MTSPSLIQTAVRRLLFPSVTSPGMFRLLGRSSSTVPDSVAQKEEPDALYRMIKLEVRGYEPAVLKSYEFFATTAAKELDIDIGRCWAPRKAIHKRLTLLKSVHIYKKHRVQYEIRTYFRHMEFLHLTGSTADTFLEYIERNLPEGVAMKVTRKRLQTIPEHLSSSQSIASSPTAT